MDIVSTAGPLELRVMGDPCPRCGGTDYYCAEEADRHIAHLQAQIARLQRVSPLEELAEQECTCETEEQLSGDALGCPSCQAREALNHQCWELLEAERHICRKGQGEQEDG